MLPFHENHGRLIFGHEIFFFFLSGMLYSQPVKIYQWYGEGSVMWKARG